MDTHIDVPNRLETDYEDVTRATQRGDFDYPRASGGGLNVPFMSIYIPASYEEEGGGTEMADRLIDRVEAMVGRAPERFAIPHSVADARRQAAEGRISLAMGMENGTPLAGDLQRLAYFHGRGIRYITLAHSKSNHISDSSYDDNKHWKGLSPFGRQLIPAMNDIGMIIDVSHVSDDAFYQIMELTRVPVLASHSSARHFTPGWERNMSDDMIRRLAEGGGVIGINFGSGFLSQAARDWSDELRRVAEGFRVEHKLDEHSPELAHFVSAWRKE